jgi:drug/metabolite transporter (DMT)-like permease
MGVQLTPNSSRASGVNLGLGLTLLSVVFFAFLGITTKLAYNAGAGLGLLLAGRFAVAAAVLWPLVWLRRSRRLSRVQVLSGLLLGCGYSLHAFLFSSALGRLAPGVVDMLFFTYPALVMVGAVALRRERWTKRGTLALVASTVGTTLVVLGGLQGIDALGAFLALSSAVAYTAYILTSACQLERFDPVALAALVATGSLATLTVGGIASGGVSLAVDTPAIALVALVGLVTVGGMSTFVAGIGRLGPSRASIISAIQPALTSVLGFVFFADRLGLGQVVGGAFVIFGVAALEVERLPRPSRSPLSWLPRRERRWLGLYETWDVAAGTSIVRQGAVAEACFIIERGCAAVTHDGRKLADLGPGDVFGEVALLNGGARTASVVALSDMRVRVLSRPEFKTALGVLPTFARTVLSLAAERMPTTTRDLVPA